MRSHQSTESEQKMRICVSSHCLLIALAVAALVTSALHIDRLQRRIDTLRSENENLKNENTKLTLEAQDHKVKAKQSQDSVIRIHEMMQNLANDYKNLVEQELNDRPLVMCGQISR